MGEGMRFVLENGILIVREERVEAGDLKMVDM